VSKKQHEKYEKYENNLCRRNEKYKEINNTITFNIQYDNLSESDYRKLMLTRIGALCFNKYYSNYFSLILHLYIQKLIFNEKTNECKVIFGYGISSLCSLEIYDKSYLCDFNLEYKEIDKNARKLIYYLFNEHFRHEISDLFNAVLILLKNDRDNLNINKIVYTTDNKTIVIPENKYFLEYFMGFNIICLICDDNIVNKESFKNSEIFLNDIKQSEYVKKICSTFEGKIEIFDDDCKIVKYIECVGICNHELYDTFIYSN
jgi:hypothetical protein